MSNYARAVAAAVGVPDHGYWCEVGRLATIYLALDARHPEFPDLDLALAWNEVNGWSAVLEIRQGAETIAIAYRGETVLPTPREARTFMADLLAGHCPGQLEPPRLRPPGRRDVLHRELRRYRQRLPH